MKTLLIRRYFALALSLILLVAVLVNVSACSVFTVKVHATDLMKGVSSSAVSKKNIDDKFKINTADFSINLFKKTITDKKSSLISPLSVMLALAMTANGADNETRTQMETALGKDISLDDLNKYLYTYVNSLPSENKSKLNIANSIWFRDELMVENDFLQKNADYYNAAAYKSAFDGKTLQDINNSVKSKTDGMIDKIIDQIDVNTVMYLINAVSFDAEWQTIYKNNEIQDGRFTEINGNTKTVKFMKSSETKYLADEKATGFIKPYATNKYSFVALLPNEDVPIEEYIETLTGESFLKTIIRAQNTSVTAYLPKFKNEYTIKMNDALKTLGITDAFLENKADFNKLGKSTVGNIYINEVVHKTFISVDERGTKAGAVTIVQQKNQGREVAPKTIKLDRPFVYAIIDNSTKLPIFIGTVMSIEN